MPNIAQDEITNTALDYLEQLRTDLNRLTFQRELLESNIKKTQEAIEKASKSLQGRFAPPC